ncbi:MAG: DMT family transporter [Planktomarina sp.]
MTQNMRGAVLMILSTTAFTINDAFIRAIGGDIPAMQMLMLRTGMVVAVLFLFVTATRSWQFDRTSRRDWRLIVLRGISEVAAAYFIVQALFNMGLAEVTAILQILPLVIPLVAALFLNEPLGWRRMLAIGVGFVGMLLIVKPGGDFNTYTIYALLGVVSVTARDLAARQIGHHISPVTLAFYMALSVFIAAGGVTMTQPWVPVDFDIWLYIAGAAVAILFGYILAVQVMRFGDVAFTSQFRYFGLIAALVIGYAVFREWPDDLTLLGALIVVSMGVFAMYRERRASKKG